HDTARGGRREHESRAFAVLEQRRAAAYLFAFLGAHTRLEADDVAREDRDSTHRFLLDRGRGHPGDREVEASMDAMDCHTVSPAQPLGEAVEAPRHGAASTAAFSTTLLAGEDPDGLFRFRRANPASAALWIGASVETPVYPPFFGRAQRPLLWENREVIGLFYVQRCISR